MPIIEIDNDSSAVIPGLTLGQREVLELFGEYNMAVGVGEGLGTSLEYLDGELL